jgi:hypothetical protein
VPLHEFISPFYVKLGEDYRSKLVVGQICITPVLYCYENREIWRPMSLDTSGTSATIFKIEAQPGDAYKSSGLLHSPRLEAYEEFPVVRAKRRPVIVLMPQQDEVDLKEHRGMMKVNKKLVTVAPCYGVVNEQDECKTDKSFLERVSNLEFPHFMFLPHDAFIPKDSLLRLDSIHHTFHPHLEPKQHALAPEIVKILLGQLERVLSIGNGDAYVLARDILLGK